MSTRSAVDRPDDFTGGQVHVIYALPRGAVDQQIDVTSRIPFSLASIDIEFVQLPKTDAEYGSDELSKFYAIYADTTSTRPGAKDYLVFYDGQSTPQACGRAFSPGGFAVVYMHGAGCWQDGGPAATSDAQPARSDFNPMHELFHTFGAQHTPQLGPDAGSQYSQTEYFNLEFDLMYEPKSNSCTFLGWFLDPYQKFYYSSTPFADGRLNTYNSPYLTPAPSK